MITRFILEEDGQSLVEYGLLISLIALAAITAITLFGRGVRNNWDTSTGKLGSAFNSSGQ
jgi:pilus assembly protein Flp/PilA